MDFIPVHPNLGLRSNLTQTDEISTNTTNNMLDFYNCQPLVGLHNISLTIGTTLVFDLEITRLNHNTMGETIQVFFTSSGRLNPQNDSPHYWKEKPIEP